MDLEPVEVNWNYGEDSKNGADPGRAGGHEASGSIWSSAKDQNEGQQTGARGGLDQKTGGDQETGAPGGFAKDQSAGQEAGARGGLDQKTGEAKEANGEQSGQGAKGVPVEVGVLIEPSGTTMDQETEVEQGDRETGGRVEVDKSAEEEERVVAGRICGDSRLWGEDARGRGSKEVG